MTELCSCLSTIKALLNQPHIEVKVDMDPSWVWCTMHNKGFMVNDKKQGELMQ